MSEVENSVTRKMCPRCRSESTDILASSPVKNAWEIHSCHSCFYAWRSTEPEENTNPDKYPAEFRLNEEELADYPIVPLIPPLR